MPGSIQTFWRRVSDGIAVNQLWAQFRAEARESYTFYSKEVDFARAEGESGGKRFWRIAQALFWALMMKLSPGRRVLFMVALVLLVLPGFRIQRGDFYFEMDNLSFFGGIVMLILLALELADRVAMKRDLEIAREIQGWLMPSSAPQIPGVDIAFATRPANTVAGDYYDAFFRPGAEGERLLLVVADVAGKSMPAALLMATLQASLRTLAAIPSTLPELATRLNQYACAQSMAGQRFTTAFLAELETATGQMIYVNAGHNWPLLRHGTGVLERLEAGGLPFGIKPDAKYDSGTTQLGAGDLLLIFTDGLVEAENEKQDEYGEPRLLNSFNTALGGTASDALKRIMTAVDGFVGPTRQHDDITCLVLRTYAA
ncbi:MAG TPA: PP2C family protein-serine/threonine phosphatase [Bryobacteraceae bacterium]|nr:PP2C family protein-serine/threonine phosphatase [Bryobacteraceae bacterium]